MNQGTAFNTLELPRLLYRAERGTWRGEKDMRREKACLSKSLAHCTLSPWLL